MTTVEPKPAPSKPKAERTLRWFPSGDDYSPIAGFLVIMQGKDQTEYCVSEFPIGWLGRGFCLFKVGADNAQYSVFVSQHGPEADSCECAGATYHPGTVCRHRAAIRKLIELGKL